MASLRSRARLKPSIMRRRPGISSLAIELSGSASISASCRSSNAIREASSLAFGFRGLALALEHGAAKDAQLVDRRLALGGGRRRYDFVDSLQNALAEFGICEARP